MLTKEAQDLEEKTPAKKQHGPRKKKRRGEDVEKKPDAKRGSGGTPNGRQDNPYRNKLGKETNVHAG